ncbi:unnamed protein product [Peronospora destructor]|uniref:Uncharacterized protein n=1 Tax=Peronospora destructor TaxID=86335 RepID=A0AAV0V8X4_9STRA|nr:unnamed protein product [Peronospora destructor]
MCRSPLLTGPFSVTSNRAFEEALAALAAFSQIRSLTENHTETNFVDAAERKLEIAGTQNSDSEVQISVLNLVESENSPTLLIHREEVSLSMDKFLKIMQNTWYSKLSTSNRRRRLAETTRHLRHPN